MLRHLKYLIYATHRGSFVVTGVHISSQAVLATAAVNAANSCSRFLMMRVKKQAGLISVCSGELRDKLLMNRGPTESSFLVDSKLVSKRAMQVEITAQSKQAARKGANKL